MWSMGMGLAMCWVKEDRAGHYGHRDGTEYRLGALDVGMGMTLELNVETRLGMGIKKHVLNMGQKEQCRSVIRLMFCENRYYIYF